MKTSQTTSLLFLLCSMLWLVSCSTSGRVYTQPAGPESGFTHRAIRGQRGFGQHRRHLLREQGLSKADFVRLSTDSAWHLSAADRARLHQLRTSLPWPDGHTLLQKVISLEKMQRFANNDPTAFVNGFVAVAADVKKLDTYPEVYYGLRLDYEDTPYDPDRGEGYALVRFYSSYTDELIIPFCEELQGTYPHSWPCSGGGFTASSLGDGGYPEWFFPIDRQPNEGAEIYSVDRRGRETLVLIYRGGQWVAAR